MQISLPDGQSITVEKFIDVFDPRRIGRLIDALAAYGRRNRGGGVSRVAFSDEDRRARNHYLQHLKNELDVDIHIDALGNLLARRRGSRPHWPALLTGSHLDTVPNGGAFDGTAGVATGVEAFRVLDSMGIRTRHPLELIVFTAEEPNPSGISTFGSRGLTGKLNPADLDGSRHPSGFPLEQALKKIGGDMDKIAAAVRSPSSVAAFVELHIEQMPTLEKEAKQIGIVSGITGLHRYRITLRGIPAHAGTTPMDSRRDALCGAAEMVLAVEAAARAETAPAVATIGRLHLTPDATNVVPENVCMDAEIRSFDPAGIEHIRQAIETCGAQLERRRGLHVGIEPAYAAAPQVFSQTVPQAIGKAAETLGFSNRPIISMAGHDAAHMGVLADSGMIFIPCRAGLSHCPEEWASPRDLLRGAQCLLLTLLNLDLQEPGQ